MVLALPRVFHRLLQVCLENPIFVDTPTNNKIGTRTSNNNNKTEITWKTTERKLEGTETESIPIKITIMEQDKKFFLGYQMNTLIQQMTNNQIHQQQMNTIQQTEQTRQRQNQERQQINTNQQAKGCNREDKHGVQQSTKQNNNK